MYSEHLNNVHPGWVVGGWLVGVAVASAALLVLVAVGLLEPDTPGGGVLTSLALAAGFFVGGLFVGLRWTDAPILHGAAITFVSVLVWFLANVLVPEEMGGGDLALDNPTVILGSLLLQLLGAVAGGWVGRRWVLRGITEEPEEG